MKVDRESNPGRLARIAGVFYLLVIATSPLAMYVRNALIVRGDGAASAANVLGHEPLYRIGIAADIFSSTCYIVVTGLLYILFKPVSRSVSLVAALFSLVGIAVSAVASVFNAVPLVILHDASQLGAFTSPQLHQLALTGVRLGGQAANIGIVFFGCYCATIGWLIFRSAFLPSILGAGMALAGLGWLCFLYQPLAVALLPLPLIAGGLGEGALTLWLLAVGVNARRWHERAAAACGPAG